MPRFDRLGNFILGVHGYSGDVELIQPRQAKREPYTPGSLHANPGHLGIQRLFVRPAESRRRLTWAAANDLFCGRH
jgi:hypothetical protein